MLSVVLSLVFAAATGVLYYMTYLPNIITAVIIALALAGLILLLAGAGCLFSPPGLRYCTGKTAGCLLLGILGTVLTGTGALATTLNVSSAIDIVLISFGAFFLWAYASFLPAIFKVRLNEPNKSPINQAQTILPLLNAVTPLKAKGGRG